MKSCLTYGTSVSRCVERITFDFTSVVHLDSLLENTLPYPTTLKSLVVWLANQVMLPAEISGSVTLGGCMRKMLALETKSAFMGEFSLITYNDDMHDYVAVTLAALEVRSLEFPKNL